METSIKKIAQQAQLALLYEVSCFPKPGLVDPIDEGSHRDMDVFTFLESSVVLLPFFESFINVGYFYKDESINVTFNRIRKIGIEAEDSMNSVTNHVNTHKGVIFSLGIFLTICGRLEIWNQQVSLKEFQKEVKKMTTNLLTDFEAINHESLNLTFGEKLYVNHGLTGIRGEAHSGYPSIFEIGLPFYEAHEGVQQGKLIDTLLYLSMYIEDTNLIKRSKNVEIFEETNQMITHFFDIGGYETKEGYSYLLELNYLFKEKNWSIGGSADALILVVFLSKLTELNLVY